MKIIYMGTPDFAVLPLENLIKHHDVCAVFTQPDKQKGRGMKLLSPPVKTIAEKHNIMVFQPQTLKSPEIINIIKDLTPDCIVVAAYGQILPSEILQIPKFGCVNIHASILPKFRGASPIQTAILHGIDETGITTMQMSEGLDTGDILEVATCKITDDDNYQTLHDKLKTIGADLIAKTLTGLENVTITPLKQDDSQSSYAPLITKDMAKLNFANPANTIHNQIRGLFKAPGAFAFLVDKRLKIHRAKLTDNFAEELPGTLIRRDDKLYVACKDYLLELLDLQLEGSRALSADDFIRGQNIINKILN